MKSYLLIALFVLLLDTFNSDAISEFSDFEIFFNVEPDLTVIFIILCGFC